MKLIVGLGNPGREYSNTRHNVGFMILDKYALKHDLSFDKSKFNGLFVETKIKNEKVIFLKPQKYMNLSGEVVKKIIDFYKIDTNDILIINDDLDLELGHYKLRLKGSSGGHNGLKDIELNINTDEYKRLKIGISNSKETDTKDYVLGKFSSDEKKDIDLIIYNATNIIDDYFVMTFEELMNKYNNN